MYWALSGHYDFEHPETGISEHTFAAGEGMLLYMLFRQSSVVPSDMACNAAIGASNAYHSGGVK